MNIFSKILWVSVYSMKTKSIATQTFWSNTSLSRAQPLNFYIMIFKKDFF